MNVVLLRVGIDTGCGGMAGPLFGDGSFEFIPIDSDRNLKGRMYGNLSGRHGDRKLLEYFPDRLRFKMQDCFVHDDPEFETCTYGDPTRPKQSLRHLKSGDLLVFYAGLCGWKDCTTPTALYIIGYFKVQCAGSYPELVRQYSKQTVHEMFAENYHVIQDDVRGRTYKDGSKSELVLVKGGSGSKLLNTAVRLSAPKKRMDGGGHPVFVVDPALKQHFGSFTNLNAIQRSIPRWVKEDHTESAKRFVLRLE